MICHLLRGIEQAEAVTADANRIPTRAINAEGV
jgi:hypothetical protein